MASNNDMDSMVAAHLERIEQENRAFRNSVLEQMIALQTLIANTNGELLKTNRAIETAYTEAVSIKKN